MMEKPKMKKINFKKAFNLAEIMIALILIGVISTLSLQVVNKSNNDYTKMYYVAFNTLLQTAGNAALNWNPICQCSRETMLEAADATREVCWSRACWEEFENDPSAIGSTPGISRSYPGYLMGDATIGEFDGYNTDVNFCQLLTANLNTINQNVECQSFINSYARADYSVGQNFDDVFCNTYYTTADEYRTNIELPTGCPNKIQPSFITANGQKFYISRLLSTNAATPAFLDIANREFFRFVAVDLNGDSAPNTQLKKGAANKNGRLPDIVLFALRADGTVVPLGRPEFSRNYINSIVHYPEFLNRYDAAGNMIKNEKANSEPAALYESKPLAWGVPPRNEAGDAVISPDELIFGQVFSPIEPFTYSSLLYNRAGQCINIPCPNTGGNYTDTMLARLVNQFTMDVRNSAERVTKTPTPFFVDENHGCTFRYSKCKVEILDTRN